MRRSPYWAKRTLDVVAAGVGLLVLLPLLPLVALAIRLDSSGPVFFRQPRVGIDRRAGTTTGPDRRRRRDHGGAVFPMIKFRTMRADAEKVAGPSWTADNDPRITRVGAVLRQTKIDELPQLWNVLRGEMSLVGPRPETPHFVAKLSEQLPVYRERVAGVKPGISGMAQIHCEDDGSFFASLREKIYYDLLYGANLMRMRHWYEPIILDVGVILKTLHRLVDLRKTIDNDVIRIELPRQLEQLNLAPEALAGNTPYGIRAEVLNSNPDKITVWWYLPRTRVELPPDRDYLGVHLMRRLSDTMTYGRDVDGKGADQLLMVKLLGNACLTDLAGARVERHAPSESCANRPPEPPLPASGHADIIKLEVPSKVQYIPKVEEFLAPIWERLSNSSTDLHFAFNMSLLVLEGLTNVIKHAHRECPEKRIPVEIVIRGDRVEVKVLDYGSGFDLEQATSQPSEELLAELMQPAAQTVKTQANQKAG